MEPMIVEDLSVDPPVLEPSARFASADNPATRSGTTTPPRPVEPVPDSRAFAIPAGLSPGSSVTVVLRIEVLGNGTIGQVQVEVSGGAHSVDEAAIAYVHALKWIGGSINDRPETIWIRWGVTLDA